MAYTDLPAEIRALDAALDARQPGILRRDKRYRNNQKLRFAASEVTGDLGQFSLPLCRLAVDAVAERMRIASITAEIGGRDASEAASGIWQRSQFDQLLQPLLVDALALGSAYTIVWPDATGRVTITPESARTMVTRHDPVSGAVTSALKRWEETGPHRERRAVHRFHYTADSVEHWIDTRLVETQINVTGHVPVVPLINSQRLGDLDGASVIDDLGDLVDAQAKILADMLVASEDVARPRRWATGVELEDAITPGDPLDEFSADMADAAPRDVSPADADADAVSPFADGNRMFTVESPDAKFGQLPGADLKGYETAVDLLTRQIMAVSALPAHMIGITGSNVSADAFRAAEASLTARAESRMKVLGLSLERALSLGVAMESAADPAEVAVSLSWQSAATRSDAQAADAAAKLFSLGIIDRDEAREMLGMTSE